jgi:Glycosyl transferase family 2
MTTQLVNGQLRLDQGLPSGKRPMRARARHEKAGASSPTSDSTQGIKVDVSFVIPLKDEQDTIVELYERISSQFGPETRIEFLFIDDGSRDASWSIIRSLAAKDHGRVRGLRFRRNCGKAAGLTAGFRAAKGAVIFTLDADLQDDPTEIHRFLEKLNEGYDLVSGWKKVRHDPWHKVLPSRVFNRMLSHFSGVFLHDHNCGFKCYRAEVAKSLTLHGEMHRMVPAKAAIGGFKVAEIVVKHHPRVHGVSKYGIERFIRGFMDMVTIGFLRKYRERPSHFLGAIVAACGLMAVCLIGTGLVVAVAWHTAAGLAAIVSGVVLAGTAVLTFACGLLAELIIRGGLPASWRLPIVEDTSPSAPSGSTNVPMSYLPA